MVAINMVGASFVARAQTFIVTAVLASFTFFIVVTLPDIDLDLLAFGGYPSFSKIVASIALTFFAYMGFNVITFTAGELRDASHDLPRAMTGALLGVLAVVFDAVWRGRRPTEKEVDSASMQPHRNGSPYVVERTSRDSLDHCATAWLASHGIA